MGKEEVSETDSKVVAVGRGSIDSFSFFLDEIHSMMDRNLRYLMMVPWVMGGVTVALIVKHRYWVRQFTSLHNLPLLAFRRHGLPMRVVGMERSYISVCHTPVLPRLVGMCSFDEESQMKVRLAGLSFPSSERPFPSASIGEPLQKSKPTTENHSSNHHSQINNQTRDTNTSQKPSDRDEGISKTGSSDGEVSSPKGDILPKIVSASSLAQKVDIESFQQRKIFYSHPDKTLSLLKKWLQGRQVRVHFLLRENDYAEVLLYRRNSFFQRHQLVNEELLRHGLAETVFLDSETLSQSQLSPIAIRLLRAELLAQKNAVGIWSQPKRTWWEALTGGFARLLRRN